MINAFRFFPKETKCKEGFVYFQQLVQQYENQLKLKTNKLNVNDQLEKYDDRCTRWHLG